MLQRLGFNIDETGLCIDSYDAQIYDAALNLLGQSMSFDIDGLPDYEVLDKLERLAALFQKGESDYDGSSKQHLNNMGAHQIATIGKNYLKTILHVILKQRKT